MAQHVTLLFVHGAGFCGQVWEPIVRRLQQSPQLRGASFEHFDLPFHGENRDESVAPQVFYLDGDEKRPRVAHPGNSWVSWSSAAVYKAVKKIQESAKPGHVIIGIGHSMGAAAMWKTEAEHPGTFGGLVLFEPIYGKTVSARPGNLDFMVSITLRREAKWPSKQAAREHFRQWKNFAAWNRESLDAWVDGAVVATSQSDTKAKGEAAVLACTPAIEASMYCGRRLWFTDDERGAPRCKVIFETGARSRLIELDRYAEAARQFPATYTLRAPIPNLSHLLVMEDPDTCTNVILADLASFPAFNTASKL